jgi:hydrogenase maturation protease
MIPSLIIGLGNSLHRDDGAGPVVANQFQGYPGVEVLTCHQLTPELATKLIEYQKVIFVDAELGNWFPRVRRLVATCAGVALTHHGDPSCLLGLTQFTFGIAPNAWLVTLPVRDLEFGEGLSAQTQKAVETAVVMIETLIHNEAY